jgi:O-antigen ligase
MIERLAINDPWLIALVLGIALLIVFFGRVDIAIGIFLSATEWAYSVDFGPTVFVWVLVATMALAAMRFYISKPKIRNQIKIHRSEFLLVFWMVLWAFWTYFTCVLMFPSALSESFFKHLIVYEYLSFAMVMVFLRSMKNIWLMSVAFVVTSLVSGLISVYVLPEPVQQLMTQPGFQLKGMQQVSYLSFAVPLSLAVLFSGYRIINARSLFPRLIYLLVLLGLVGLLIMTNARQSAVGVAVGLGLMLVWYGLERTQITFDKKLQWVLLVLSVVSVVWWLYTNTLLGERWRGSNLAVGYEGRVMFYEHAWKMFLSSPVWGRGWQYVSIEGGWAHNLVLDVMASQGVVGLFFLLVFLWMVLKKFVGTWQKTGVLEQDSWRICLLSCFIYVMIQQFFSGGLTSPHVFWVSSLLLGGASLAGHKPVFKEQGVARHLPELVRSQNSA